jgi:hypothetical protein
VVDVGNAGRQVLARERAREVARAPVGEVAPAPVREDAPAPVGEDAPAPVREDALARAGPEVTCGEPSPLRSRCCTRKPSSFVAWPPTRATVFSADRSSSEAASARARSQLVSRRKPPTRISGVVMRSGAAKDWYPNRPLSQSQPSSTSSLSRASTRRTFASSRIVSFTLHCDGHSVQTVPESSMSQGRARKR